MRRSLKFASIVASAAIAVSAATGCSSGGTGTTPTVDSTPAVSLPGDKPSSGPSTSTPSNDGTGDFSSAVEFARLAHLGDYGAAGGLVADNSPAARYLAHQTAYRRAYELNGQPITENSPNDVTVDGDAKTGDINIEINDGDETTKYTWKNFAFDSSSKITAWTGKSGPIDKVLWSKSDSDEAHGVTVKLVSAYVSNGGDLIVVTEVSSPKRAIRVDDAVFTPADGYRQQDTAGLYTEVGKGEKAMTVFSFPDAKIGGKLRLELGRIDTNDPSSSYELGTVTLNIK